MAKKKLQIIAPTEQEVQYLSTTHGKLNHVILDSEEEGVELHFYFKKLDRKTLSAALQTSGENHLDTAYTIAINTMVWGNKELLEDSGVLLGIAQKINGMIGSYTSVLKKI
jgi:hypothetical protein